MVDSKDSKIPDVMVEELECVDSSIRKEQDSMSCFNYMKEHSGFFAACVSAFVAVAAFLFNATLYRKIGGYLEYWGFRVENVDIVYNNQIYVLVGVMVFCLVSLGISWFLGKTFYVYQQHADIRYYLVLAVRYLRCDSIMLKLSVWWIGVRVRLMTWRFGKGKRLRELENNNADTKEKTKRVSEKLKITRKKLRKIRITNILKMLPSILIANLMMVLVFMLFAVFENSVRVIEAVIVAMLFTLSYDLLMFIMVKFEFAQRLERKKTKQKIKRDPEEAYALIDELATKIYDQYPAESIVKSKFVELFTNRRIVVAILAMAFSLLYVFLFIPSNIDDITTKKSEFSVVNIDEQEYAIIYTSGNTYYLDMAEVNLEHNVISIDTSKQRIIVSNDMSYEVAKFKSVVKIPADGGEADE